MNLGWLYRLAAARQLHAEVALRSALAVLNQTGISPEVLQRPELESVQPREQSGIDAVLRVAGGELSAASAALRAAGWKVLPERCFSRDGVLLEVTLKDAAAAERRATAPEPRWRERFCSALARVRGKQRRFRFLEHDLIVHAGVFRPGPFSEKTVGLALEQIKNRPGARVIDAGTGTGAMALAVAAARSDAYVLGLDISHAAVRNARHNGRRLRINNAQFRHCELLGSVPAEWRGTTDLIVANLPYIPGIVCEHAELRGINWRGPLWSVHGQGADGLDLQRKLARQATTVLRPGAALVLEVDVWQSPVIAAELAAAGYNAWEVMPGLVAARWAAADR
jgi:release factor glutamine methyltransferase